jgi:putative ABC transport system permease protein
MNFSDVAESAYMAIDTVRTNQVAFGPDDSRCQRGRRDGNVHWCRFIQGLNKAFAQQIESLGSNTIWVLKFDSELSAVSRLLKNCIARTHHRRRRCDRNEAPSVSGVAPFYRKIAETVLTKTRQSDTPILLGVVPSHEFVLSSYAGYGRYVTDLDVEERANVCVLGRDVVHALFPNEDPLNKEMKIAGRVFRVVGVMEPLGSFSRPVTR